jgi:lambda family phage portal protein
MPRVQLLDHRGSPLARTRDGRPLRGKYDAASNSDDTLNHWLNADGLSARAANDPETRRKLRNRSRYERDNNSYCSGMCETLANDVVGTGPRLQVLTPGRDANERLAASFEEWTAAAGLAETLRTYREDRSVSGEGFLALTTNPVLPTPVQLDLRLIEADQVATPWALPADDGVDGIEYDAYGNPAYYHVLREHPGDTVTLGAWGEYDRVPASLILHWFKRRRPGQARGVPEITPSLPLFALLRRYDLATVTAAEVAALFAALLKTNLPPPEDEEDAPDTVFPWQRQELTRGMMIALPEGYDAVQMRPEHPATTHEMFMKVTLRGIARCLHIPYAIAAGDLSDTNYSSGQLGFENYRRTVGIDRYFLETKILDPILRAWIAEARLTDPRAVAAIPPGRLPRHQWSGSPTARRRCNASVPRTGTTGGRSPTRTPRPASISRHSDCRSRGPRRPPRRSRLRPMRTSRPPPVAVPPPGPTATTDLPESPEADPCRPGRRPTRPASGSGPPPPSWRPPAATTTRRNCPGSAWWPTPATRC